MPPPKAKTPLVLTAGKCVPGGFCLSSHGGKTVFLEGAVPGEEVEARTVQEKKDLLYARTVRVLKPSPGRVEPVCVHTAVCGGCQYQHMSYQEELSWKEAQVRETVEKSLGLSGIVRPILRGPKEYGYRRSAVFHAVGGGRGKMPRFAYIGKDNVSAVPLSQCDILDPALERMIVSVPMHAAGKIGYKLDEKGRVIDDRKESFFRVTLSGQTFLAHSQGFFQNNWEVTEILAAKLRGWVEETAPDVFFDLYAGVGTFTFLAARDVPATVAIEESRASMAALRMNRQEKKLEELELVEGRVERAFPEAWQRRGSPRSLVLFDPPRQGMEKSLATYLGSQVDAQRLIYISCDPATMTRDLRLILSGGRYSLESVTPFDMFPRTKHVEAAALLLYKGS